MKGGVGEKLAEEEGDEECAEVAALWVVDPRSLAEGMRSDLGVLSDFWCYTRRSAHRSIHTHLSIISAITTRIPRMYPIRVRRCTEELHASRIEFNLFAGSVICRSHSCWIHVV